MATYQDPFGIGTGIGSYYQGALAKDPRLPAINRNISGTVAPDVRNMLAQSAAERGIGIGSYGAGNDQSAFLKALGLTSMDLTNKGIGQYGEAYNQVPQLRPGDLFVNPTDEAQMKLQQQLQTENLNSAAGRQWGQQQAAQGMANQAQAESNARFKQNRDDALAAAAATQVEREKYNSRAIDSILGRLSGQSSGQPGSSYNPISMGRLSENEWANWENEMWGPDATSDPYWDNPSTGQNNSAINYQPTAQDWSNYDNLDYYGGY